MSTDRVVNIAQVWNVRHDVPIVQTGRVRQMQSIFDVPPAERATHEITADLTEIGDEWSIGAIVGPSGSGKSTLARLMFGDIVDARHEWPTDRSVLDGFPKMSIRDIVSLLSSVGFSSPPSWVKPYHVLSTGERFRVDVARTLAEHDEISVIDEFTSVVDRRVAQIGSAAIAKAVRRSDRKIVVVSCHEDILDWLEPDWVYMPHLGVLERGHLWRRPEITLEITRVYADAWKLFAHHHYLSRDMHKAARSFVAFWNDEPVAFTSWLPMPSGTIRNRLSDTIASAIAGCGLIPMSTTANPALIHHRNRSPLWHMHRKPGTSARDTGKQKTSLLATRSFDRHLAGFRYVGEPMERESALALWNADD
jgi:ABC-type lipoprotein export system ATPase subunit